MARTGVTYDTIKQNALKLLSQGIPPSVQKIRETLGTGSHTTIAQHLKTWREEYASKAIHHLPAHLPNELISMMEVLWQTAMEQATEQLGSVKHELLEGQEKLRLEQHAIEKTQLEWKAQLSQQQTELDNKINHLQTLQTELAVTQEKFTQQQQALTTLKNQHQIHLNHLNDEKAKLIEQYDQAQSQINQLKNTLQTQSDHYQAQFDTLRMTQDASEKRWLNLVDHARTETKQQQKKSDAIIDAQQRKIQSLNIRITELQQVKITLKTTLDQKEIHLKNLTQQADDYQRNYQQATKTIATLQDHLNHITIPTTNKIIKQKKSSKKLVETKSPQPKSTEETIR